VNSDSRDLRGVSENCGMVEILWHRRETRRLTEKTNLDLYARKGLIYSPCGRARSRSHAGGNPAPVRQGSRRIASPWR